jgi:hypothetical protein
MYVYVIYYLGLWVMAMARAIAQHADAEELVLGR